MSDNGKFQRDMTRLIKEAQRTIGKKLPGVVKIEGLDFIHDNFDKQGFDTGGGVEKWPERKMPKYIWRRSSKGNSKSRQLRATKAGNQFLKDQGRSLLVKKGHLRRAWDRDTKASEAEVAFKNTLPYAEPHNEGTNAGRGVGFTMPERRMIGDSRDLDKRIMKKIDTEMQKIINKP